MWQIDQVSILTWLGFFFASVSLFMTWELQLTVIWQLVGVLLMKA